MFWGSTRGSTKKKLKIKTPKRYDNKRDNVLMLPPAPPPHLRQQDPCGVKRFLKTCSPSLQARTENIVSFFETCYPTLQNDSPLLFSWFWGLLETSKKKKSATELWFMFALGLIYWIISTLEGGILSRRASKLGFVHRGVCVCVWATTFLGAV